MSDLQGVEPGDAAEPKKEGSPKAAFLFGASGETRTPDLLITNQLLYRLSYTSVSKFRKRYLNRTAGRCQFFFASGKRRRNEIPYAGKEKDCSFDADSLK